jgi:hypothetical protein
VQPQAARRRDRGLDVALRPDAERLEAVLGRDRERVAQGS